MKRISLLTLITLFISVFAVKAQIGENVSWTKDFKVLNENEAVATFKAELESGWHMYSFDIPEGGPYSTEFNWENLSGVELDGALTPSRKPHEEFDAVFEMNLGWWDNEVTFTQKFKITDKNSVSVSGYVSYQLCSDGACIAPSKEQFTFTHAFNNAAVADTAVTAAPAMPVNDIKQTGDLWAPVDTGEKSTVAVTHDFTSLLYIFFAGFAGGLIALLTPCVWPMIPMTVSFFLKKSGTRSRSIRDAIIYGVSIIVIYLVLGILITLLFGASSLNELSTNAIFNIIFFLLLVVFAVSFFGAFDIKLPSSWSNHMDSKAEATTGLLSIFFMAFTLTLVSFSCTGPIIGTLLVEAATMGNITGPAVGMFGFAFALAIPFTLFAIFPSWLKEMPKSGGWLNSVKVVLGFIELALSLKFLSVADLAYGWGILDREVFVSLWIVIFALLGFYLLGKIRFPHDGETKSVGVFRFFLAMISLSFAVYLVPGLWGAPLKSVSAFVPPLHTQDFNLYEGGKFVEFDDYDEGMRYAKNHDMPVLIDFSGHGCVNCRKMEAAVFDNDKVREAIQKDYVMIKLMVDDRADLAKPEVVMENGKELKLTTVGEKWSYLQRYKFAANSQPYYVVLDNKGELMSGPYYYDEDVYKFMDFLNLGVENYKK